MSVAVEEEEREMYASSCVSVHVPPICLQPRESSRARVVPPPAMACMSQRYASSRDGLHEPEVCLLL